MAGRNCRGCPDVCGYVCGRCASTASGGLGATIGAPRAGALGAAGEPSLHLVWGFAPLLGAEGSEVGCFTPTAGANPRAGCIPHPQSGDSAPTRGANHRQGCMPANQRRVTPRPSLQSPSAGAPNAFATGTTREADGACHGRCPNHRLQTPGVGHHDLDATPTVPPADHGRRRSRVRRPPLQLRWQSTPRSSPANRSAGRAAVARAAGPPTPRSE